jgi:hypothetical protein
MEGAVQSYRPLRGWGIILVGVNTRYWFHATYCKRNDVMPFPGMRVRFKVKPPQREGQLYQAYDVEPIESRLASGQAALDKPLDESIANTTAVQISRS